ncbi:hypothetical protein Tco_0961813 [Tanacetum coccineum]
MADNLTKAQCKHCFHFLASGSNSTLRNHITHPHCEALKTVSEAGQSSMAQDESVFVYNLDAVRKQFVRTRLTPATLEMCMCLKDHLDATDRKQHTSNLENCLDFEEEILEEEVQDNEAIALSDEEIALDEAASDARSNGSCSGGEDVDLTLSESD